MRGPGIGYYRLSGKGQAGCAEAWAVRGDLRKQRECEERHRYHQCGDHQQYDREPHRKQLRQRLSQDGSGLF